MTLSPVLVATGDPAGESLENFNTNVLANGAICYVEGGPGQGEWQLNKEATDAPDGTTIVEPIAGPGRWFLRIPGAFGPFSVGAVQIEGVTDLNRGTHVGRFVESSSVGGAQAVLTSDADGGWLPGDVVYFSRISAAVFSVVGDAGVVVRNPAATGNLDPQYASGMARNIGTNTWILSGSFE